MATPTSLDGLFRQYLKLRPLAPRSVTTYQTMWGLLPAGLRKAKLAEITAAQLAEATAGLSVKSRRYVLALLRGVFRLGIDLGAVRTNPAALVSSPRPSEHRPRIVTDDEFRAVYARADQRLRTCLVLARYGGLRHSEVTALRWADVDFPKAMIHVVGKGGKYRLVPMGPTVRAELTRQLAFAELRTPTVVADQYGQPWGLIRRDCQRVRKLAQVEHFRYHDLRASFLSELANKGMPMAQLKAIAGHSSIATTAKYYLEADLEAARRMVR